MKAFLRYLLMSVWALVAATEASAQVTVEAEIDSISILVGQQAHLEVGVTAPQNAHITWPKLRASQYLVPGVEVVDVADGGSEQVDGNLVRTTKRITLTSFDEKLYPIPGMKVRVNGKVYVANQLALKVVTIDVDTLHPNQFFPPKGVQDNPFMWSEWSPLFWLSIIMLLGCALAYYLYIRLRENKPIVAKIRIVKRVLPHQRALSAMQKIKAENLEHSEDQKTYYTQLTEALRQYIKERFGFNAMEMTSAEIIDRLQQCGDKKMIDELRELFLTADLVKFAKYSTLINENDLNLVNAINFIDQTKQENVPTEERIVPKLSEADKRSRQTRRTIKWIISVVIAAVAVLLAYIVYSAIQLVM